MHQYTIGDFAWVAKTVQRATSITLIAPEFEVPVVY